MDELEHVEVDEAEIAPFLPEIYRKLEWLSKEDLVQRLVSREFGRFLRYYAEAPVIEQPAERREQDKADKTARRANRRDADAPRVAEEGYTRLFINLGKRDNFYAREIINLINRYVRGSKVQIGRIDLTQNCSFFEVPNDDVDEVMAKMKRAKVGPRAVVIDYADRTPDELAAIRSRRQPHSHDDAPRPSARRAPRLYADQPDARRTKAEWKAEKKGRKASRAEQHAEAHAKPSRRKDDWRKFFD